MKTPLELPDELFRSVKAKAAQEGIGLKEYVASALRQKLGQPSERSGERLRMKHFGSLAHLRKETRRIGRIIEKEFETIDRTLGNDSGHECYFRSHRWRS